MKKSIVYLLILITCLALSMGVACAGENLDTPLTVEKSQLEVENTEISPSSKGNLLEESQTPGTKVNLKASNAPVDSSQYGQNNQVLTANEGTFTELQELIDGHYGSTLVLNKSYTFDPDFNPEGIHIGESITIDGNNNVLNGNNFGRIFNIAGENVILKNIKFINGNSTEGGAICFVDGGAGNVINCIFDNNSANFGGAIFGGSAENSTFINNTAKIYGGAIHDCAALNCTFIGNSAVDGGAMSGGSAVNCTFIGNHATFGGAIRECYALNCNFTGNTAKIDGGAMYYGAAVNCTFIGNSAEDDGGAIHNARAVNCTFIGNSAKKDGGAINFGYAVNSTFINNSAYNGGAMWCKNWEIVNCIFSDNTAVFGSALYIAGSTTISDSSFFNNLANSTSLELIVNLTGNNVTVKSVLTGGDNLLNGIYLMKHVYPVSDDVLSTVYPESDDVLLKNVTYLGFNGVMNTGDDWITPVDSADLSENGTLVYMDDREAGQNITVELYRNGVLYGEYTFSSDIYGAVSAAFTDLKPGNYTVKSYLRKNNYYTPVDASANFSIPKIDDYEMEIDTTSFAGDAAYITVILPSDATGNVTVTDANGNNYTGTVGYYGIADVEVPGLPLGENDITITYSGDDQYVGSTVNATVQVELMPTFLIVENLEKYQGDDDRFAVVLYDARENPVAGMPIKIHIVGKVYNCTTNAEGIATLPINLKPGIYPVTVEFAGKGNYSNATSASGEVHVLTKVRIDKNKDFVKDYGDADKFTVRLLDKYGKPVAGEVVNMTVAGKTYHCKSNADGYASLAINLKPGTYNIICEYAGYKATNKITVKQVLSAVNRQYKKASSYQFTATLKHTNGKPISGKTVTFSFKGKTYTANTNSKGEATINIKEALNIAKHNIYITYLNSTITRTITIK